MRKCLVRSSFKFLLWKTINTIEGRGSDGFGVRLRLGLRDVIRVVAWCLVLFRTSSFWLSYRTFEEEEELHKKFGHWCAVGEVEGEDSV